MKQYDVIMNFREGLAGVKYNSKWGGIDEAGNEVIPCKYDYVDYFQEGLARVYRNGKWGYVDKAGKEVIPCQYNETQIVSILQTLKERCNNPQSFTSEELLNKDFMTAFINKYTAKTEEQVMKAGTTIKQAEEIGKEYEANVKEINLRIIQEAGKVVKKQAEIEKLAKLKACLIAKLDEVEFEVSKGETIDD